MWAAATTRRTGMQPNIFIKQNTRSSRVSSPAKTGFGATSTSYSLNMLRRRREDGAAHRLAAICVGRLARDAEGAASPHADHRQDAACPRAHAEPLVANHSVCDSAWARHISHPLRFWHV